MPYWAIQVYEAALFLKRILEHPDDDAPRLVYADWLEERGDPLGEFIRLQCALANWSGDQQTRSKLSQREQALYKKHRMDWAKPFQGIANRCTFGRGLVEGITISAAKFLEHGSDLFDWAPLRRIRVTQFSSGQIDSFAADPALGRVAELDLTANDLQDAGIERLTRSPYLSRLRRLNLSVNSLTDRGLQTLVNCPGLHELPRLDLSHNHIRNPQPCTRLSHLIELDLSHNDCSIDAILAMQVPQLNMLQIAGNPLGDARSSRIIRDLFAQVAGRGSLDLSNCGVADEFVGALVASPHRHRLQILKLDGNALGDSGMLALARADGFDRLTQLHLAGNGITDVGAFGLANSELFARLIHLDLRQNQLSRGGVDHLWTSDCRHPKSVLLFADNIPPQPVEETLDPDAAIPIVDDD